MFVDEHLDLYSHFDYAVLSYKEKLKKPDERFYQLAISKAGCKPEEAVFIDDKEECVLAAQKLGIKGIIFKDNDQLKLELSELGVKFSS